MDRSLGCCLLLTDCRRPVQLATEASRSLILYSVGPATTRSLVTLRDSHLRHADIQGSDAGNGQNLARYILSHYNSLYTDGGGGGGETKPPLLFLVGEQRRDIIPKTLMSESLPAAERIAVDELVLYETRVMQSFTSRFRSVVDAARSYLQDDRTAAMWVVVFSPTGCDAMLSVLRLGATPGSSGGFLSLSSSSAEHQRRVFIATIGPTTREHLRSQFGVEADVCAEKPSPDGVGRAIDEFMRLTFGSEECAENS